jgi:hypothetical protein
MGIRLLEENLQLGDFQSPRHRARICEVSPSVPQKPFPHLLQAGGNIGDATAGRVEIAQRGRAETH